MDIQQIKSAALAKRNAGDFVGAEAMFRQAFTLAPSDVDCAHMLGVLCFRQGRAREAMHYFATAGMLAQWQVPAITRNFGLALSHVYAGEITVKRIAYLAWLSQRRRAVKPVNPLVSVVVPSYNHARFIDACLDSVYGQAWARIELIVIDDGSTDDSAARIREKLKSCPFPHQFIARENRGAHHTINEAIALATGDYINILNSDDRFLPQRIEKMVAQIAAIGADWGFADVEVVNDEGNIAEPIEGSLAGKLKMIAASAHNAPTIGFALLRHNVAISTGNFFIRTAFFRYMGGFSNLRYVHDQEFALRATLLSEPIYVAEKLYEYRVHGNNTISEVGSNATAETATMLDQHLQKLFGLVDASAVSNPFAPTRTNWGEYVASFALRSGFGGLLSPNQLTEIAQRAINHSAVSAGTSLDSIKGVVADYTLLETMLQPPTGVQATFDQFQRYGIVARAVEYLRQPGQIFSILEVGANTHRILGQLLPNDKITYLDREIPLEMQGANDVLVGDATRLEMPDGAFDIVIALDVFEHIEPHQRADFLRHISRVSRVTTMLGAPFASDAVSEAENGACTFWNRLFNTPYRWLVEHAENGLPDLVQTQQQLHQLGMKRVHFGHGNLLVWCEMMKAHFAAEACAELRAPIAAMDSFYRDHLLVHDVGGDKTYRQFLLCSHDELTLARLTDFSVSLQTAQGLPNMTPLIDVLQAMQHIANHRPIQS
jgi:glycosyltransferase involved in cell wall biosynthesis